MFLSQSVLDVAALSHTWEDGCACTPLQFSGGTVRNYKGIGVLGLVAPRGEPEMVLNAEPEQKA